MENSKKWPFEISEKSVRQEVENEKNFFKHLEELENYVKEQTGTMTKEDSLVALERLETHVVDEFNEGRDMGFKTSMRLKELREELEKIQD